MKKNMLFILVLVMVFSVIPLFAQQNGYYIEQADRDGLHLGITATVPAPFILLTLDTFEVLAGPKVEMGLSDQLSITGSVAPAIRLSSLLTELLQSGSTTPDDLVVGIGLAQAGGRYYFRPARESFFVDADAVALFFASNYDYKTSGMPKGFTFDVSAAILGLGFGYDFGDMALEFGGYFVTPIGQALEDLDTSVVISKIGISYMF